MKRYFDLQENRLKDAIEGKFDALPEDQRDRIMQIVSHFHYRDCKKYDDGSMGTVHISPRQMNNLLAFQGQAQIINPELEFLSDFFEAWESFQQVAGSDCHGHKKQLAAQNLVEAANRVRNYRNPVQGLVPND